MSHVTPTNALLYNVHVQSFTQLLHVSALFFHYLQPADTKFSLKPTAIKQVMINIHMLWYQQCNISVQVLVKIMCVVGFFHHTPLRDGSKFDQQHIDFCTQIIIITQRLTVLTVLKTQTILLRFHQLCVVLMYVISIKICKKCCKIDTTNYVCL